MKPTYEQLETSLHRTKVELEQTKVELAKTMELLKIAFEEIGGRRAMVRKVPVARILSRELPQYRKLSGSKLRMYFSIFSQ